MLKLTSTIFITLTTLLMITGCGGLSNVSMPSEKVADLTGAGDEAAAPARVSDMYEVKQFRAVTISNETKYNEDITSCTISSPKANAGSSCLAATVAQLITLDLEDQIKALSVDAVECAAGTGAAYTKDPAAIGARSSAASVKTNRLFLELGTSEAVVYIADQTLTKIICKALYNLTIDAATDVRSLVLSNPANQAFISQFTLTRLTQAQLVKADSPETFLIGRPAAPVDPYGSGSAAFDTSTGRFIAPPVDNAVAVPNAAGARMMTTDPARAAQTLKSAK